MSFFFICIVALLVFYIVTVAARFGHLSPISLFVYAQATMALGTLPLLQEQIPADLTHSWILLWTFGLLVIGAAIYGLGLLTVPKRSYTVEIDFDFPRPHVELLIWLSVGICVAYYSAVGYLAILESLRAIASGTETDLAALRLESYSGSRYLFPGYVNQFKNALLPALTVVVIAQLFASGHRWRWAVSVTLGATAILFLLGTGQRGAFVSSGIMTVIAIYLIAPKIAPKATVWLTFLVVPLFFLSTLASGRAARDLESTEGLFGGLGVMFEQLAFRLLGSNQESSVAGFRYIFEREVPFAQEWWQSLIGLFPGQPGSDLSNRIFASLYGSTRGTAPLSIWGSAYHNLGFVGTLVFAAILAFALCSLSARINRLSSTNTIQLVGAAGMTESLGTWLAGSPDALLNKGLIVFAALWVWGSRTSKRDGTEQRGTSRRYRLPSPKTNLA